MRTIKLVVCALLRYAVALSTSSKAGASFLHKEPLPQSETTEDQLTKATVSELQAFTKTQKDGIAAVVLIGDSSVRGLVEALVKLAPSSQVYRASDMVHYTNEHLDRKVKAGTFHHNVQLVAMKGYRALHDQNCTVSGGLEATVFDAPLEGLVLYHWEFIPEYGDACWKPCMIDAVKAFQPSAVLWNIGLHLLSVNYDENACSREHGKNHMKQHCSDYEGLVSMGMQELASATPTLVWRTTNWVCWDKIKSKPDWHDPNALKELEHTCHQACPFAATESCSDWLLDEHSTGLQYERSMRVVDEVQKQKQGAVHVLDAFAASKENCDATEDGVHYKSLDGQLAHSFASILSRREQST